MRITKIEPQAHDSERYNIYVDGTFALGLDAAIVVSEALSPDRELTAADLERLRTLEGERKLFDAALHFLAPRPRSRAEVRRRLLTPRPNKALPERETVDRVLDRLEQLGMLNDRDFAEFWVENRERFSPRSSRALGQELRQKGVPRDTVDEVSRPERDEERAVEAGRQRLRSLANSDYQTFRTRLGQFLLRRGFGYGAATSAVRQLWAELHDERPEDDAEDDIGALGEEE